MMKSPVACTDISHVGTSSPKDDSRVWDEWQDHVSPFFDLYKRDETDLSKPISMRSYHLGGILVGDVVAPAQDLLREARKTARQGVDHVLLQFYTSGRSRLQARQDVVATGGTMVLYDLSQPITVRSDEAVDALNILLPRAALDRQNLRVEALHGTATDFRADAVGEITFSLLQGILDNTHRLEAHHLPALSEATARLCGAFLEGSDAGGEADDLRARVEIRSFIRDNLSEIELGPELLQRRFGMSRATLYREFAGEGGVRAYIRERRLMAALRLLTRLSPKGRRPRVSSVAYAVGFEDEKSFSRAFRSRFGFLPSEVRAGDAGPDNGDGGADVLLSWIRDLTGQPEQMDGMTG